MPPGIMPVRSTYSPVEENGDSRVPLHNKEAFQHGIHFQAKDDDHDSLYTIVSQQNPANDSPSSCSSLTPLASQHRMKLIQHQLQQQQQQTQVAAAQVQLLKDQLAAETSARIEAQTRVRQLLLTNRDLLQHISLLVKQLKEMELKAEHKQTDDKLSQNVTIAQSVSLNLKNLYSLDLNLPATSTPASLPGGSFNAESIKGDILGESYLNLINLDGSINFSQETDDCLVWSPSDEQNGFIRKVEGSEVSEAIASKVNGTQKLEDLSPAVEERFHSVIPKLDPPPPVIRKRSTKALLVPESESSCTDSDVHAILPSSTMSSLTDVTPCSLTTSDFEFISRSATTKAIHVSCLDNAELSPIKEHMLLSFDKELAVQNGTFYYSIASSYDNLEGSSAFGVIDRKFKALEHVGAFTDNTLPFSSVANDTCLHISFSEDELPNFESADAKECQRQASLVRNSK